MRILLRKQDGSATRRGGEGSGTTEHIPPSPPAYAKAADGKPCTQQKTLSAMRIALFIKNGEMPERPKGHDWKSCVPTKIGTEGSNPSLSATNHVGFVAALNST
jgi:hypothetical protein